MNGGQLPAIYDLQSVEQKKKQRPDGIVGEGKSQMIGP